MIALPKVSRNHPERSGTNYARYQKYANYKQTEIIADNCKALVALKDSKDAAEILRALHVDDSIVFGCIYTLDGKAFTSY